MAQSPIPDDIASNPSWYIHNYLPIQQNFVLAFLEELQFVEAPFLDQRFNAQIRNFFQVSFEDLDARFPASLSASRPAVYIFHIGHCGSTLISRALGATPSVLALREPLILRVLSNSLRELDSPLSWLSLAQFQRLQTIILTALERRFRPSQLPLIKATSTGNNLIGPVLESHPLRRALLIHQPLESYLAGMLRFREHNLGDIRNQSQTRLQDWHDISGDQELRLSSLEPVDLVVIAWLSSMARMARAQENHPDRVLRVDFEGFLAHPEARLEEMAGFAGLADAARSIVDAYPRISGYYSKNSSQLFSTDERRSTLARSRDQNGELIRAGLKKARQLLQQYPSLGALEASFN